MTHVNSTALVLLSISNLKYCSKITKQKQDIIQSDRNEVHNIVSLKLFKKSNIVAAELLSYKFITVRLKKLDTAFTM